jgi:ABC-type branched-subunit amino acid transport system substrate-binding protein
LRFRRAQGDDDRRKTLLYTRAGPPHGEDLGGSHSYSDARPRDSPHQAQTQLRISNDTVKLGVLTDMSSIYTDNSGPGSVAAAQMAVADFGGTVLGKRIEVVSADNLNKADVGASVTREWIDRDGASCSATRALSLTPRLTADNKNSRTPARLAAKADVRIEL